MRVFFTVLFCFFILIPFESLAWYRLPSVSHQQFWPPSRRIIIQKKILQYPVKRFQRKVQIPSSDPLPDTNTRPNILLLGSVSPIVGAARIYMQHEPLNVSEIQINLVSASPVVDSFLVYRSDTSILIGRATLDPSDSGRTRYTLRIKSTNLILPKQEEFLLYVRARTRPFESVGISGETIQISSFNVTGVGSWSNRSYARSTIETNPMFQTARSQFTVIQNSGPDDGFLQDGPGRLIGEFMFGGITAGGSSDLRITDLMFTIEQAGDIGISNAILRRDGLDERILCSSSSILVTCTGLSETFGSVRVGPVIFRLYGDIAIPKNAKDAYLRLAFNRPGNPDSSGAIFWNDGTNNFDWVPFDHPISRGTLWRN